MMDVERKEWGDERLAERNGGLIIQLGKIRSNRDKR